MKIAYFDCFHGAAGDMLLASLLDAGLERSALEQVLATIPISGYSIEHQRCVSHHVGGSRLRVIVHEPQPTRTWTDIRHMLENSALPDKTRAWAIGTFARLARVEASVHAMPVETVHFHEVGAVDSIVDLVGVCAGLELLGIERVYASALPVGRGWIAMAHGYLPVPPPATLALLAEVGAPTLPGPTQGELLTPTAAALLAELACFEQPAMRVQRVGYGFGQKEYERLNGLRVWIGTTVDADNGAGGSKQSGVREESTSSSFIPPQAAMHEAVTELRCNVDDTTGEVVAYVIEQLLAAGGLDAWAVPLVMKKGRPGLQLACLARPADVEMLAHLILREMPTLGVRWEHMQRLVAARSIRQVTTPWGSVRIKQKILDGTVVSSAPEYEDCAALSRAHGVPLTQVFAAALQGDRA